MLVDPCFQQLTPDNPMPETAWLRVANQLINAGVTHLLVAPLYPATSMFPERMHALVTMYQEMLDRRGVPLVIYPGQTVLINQPLRTEAFTNELLYADLNQRYLLVQAPEDITFDTLLGALFEALRRNIIPVLVNPEKLSKLSDDDIQQLRDQGIKLMVSNNSLRDRHYAKRLTRWFNQQWVTTIGSVAGEAEEPVDYRQTTRWLDQHVGRSYRDDLRLNNKALLNGDPFIENHHFNKRHRLFGKRK
ncbi:MAG: hypothetical protein MR008_02345 [Aerococcus sp.]|nr:hypothetical protein [Aerococcus sp.]